jgi:TolA-binding protein
MTSERRIHAADAEHPEDLVALERQERLAEPEKRRLQMCLAASDSLGILRQVGLDFDAMHTAQPEDAAQLEQLVAQARSRFAPRIEGGVGRSRGRKLAAGVALSFALFALGATAARFQLPSFVGFGRVLAKRAANALPLPSVTQPRGQVTEVTPAAPNGSAPNDNSAALPSAEAERGAELKAPVAPGTGRAGASRAGGEVSSSTGVMGGSELFSAANAARRRGEIEKSATLYRSLQNRYPHSAEAASSYVLLARMNLARGAAVPALTGFSAYLREVPGGSLTQEALQGKAQALRQLRRATEERATLRELLREFPDSVYAPGARERLGTGD